MGFVDFDKGWVESVGGKLVEDEGSVHFLVVGGCLVAVTAKTESGLGKIGLVHLRM